jgi:[ribosomal protein S18]-alanine N-acetyltransferase
MTRTNESVQIRRMTGIDIERVVEIAAGLRLAPQWPPDAYLAALDPSALLRRIALVAEDPSTAIVIGFAVASLTIPESELETIVVAEGVQRRGIARQVFAKMAETLRHAGATVSVLEVRTSNEPARAFYQSLGFREAGRRPCYYANPVEDAVLMTLRFN